MDFMQEEKHRLLCKRKSKPSASDYVVLDDDSIIKKKNLLNAAIWASILSMAVLGVRLL